MMTTITLLHKKSFQSTHSLRSATEHPRDLPVPGSVSIHALLAECDRTWAKAPCGQTCFNPRTPCGVRHAGTEAVITCQPFQSTHSLRSATHAVIIALPERAVSIHALLAECDRQISAYRGKGLRFQSTHSLRSATRVLTACRPLMSVSIHALLAECDCARPYTLLLNRANHTLRQPP